MASFKYFNSVFGGLKLAEHRINSVMLQQTRNTYVLKRMWTPLLPKFNSNERKILKSKHFIYEPVESTNSQKMPKLDLILTSYVEGLGEPGELVSVKRNYGRNCLLLPKLAVYASPENFEEYSELIKSRKETPKKTYSTLFATTIIRVLSKKIFTVTMNSNEPWVIEPWHIQVSLRNANIVAPLHTIELPEEPISGPNIANIGKDFAVFVTINQTEKVPIRCRLQHHGEHFESLNLSSKHKMISESILNEQADLLKSMPIEDDSNLPKIVEKRIKK